MAAMGACILSAGVLPAVRCCATPSSDRRHLFENLTKNEPITTIISKRSCTASQTARTFQKKKKNKREEKEEEEEERELNISNGGGALEVDKVEGSWESLKLRYYLEETKRRNTFKKKKITKSDSDQNLEISLPEETVKMRSVDRGKNKKKKLRDFFEESKALITSSSDDGGPPRWFSPLDCASRLAHSPLLLYLPGIDGVGLGLIMHHHALGMIFDTWCLHIPVKDRTSFTDLIKLVERTVISEHQNSPNRPIYLVGESLGACIVMAVAARNPDIDLVLILSNPATSFGKSQLQPLLPLLEAMPDQPLITHSYILSLMTGDPLRMTMDYMFMLKQFPPQQSLEELAQDIVALPFYLNVLAGVLPRETLIWKLQMFKLASAFVNSRIHAIKTQTIILSSGKDQLLPSEEEGKRLYHALPNCEIRKFDQSGHFLFLEDGVDLVTTIKGACFYRHGRYFDHVSDYIPPTQFEFNNICELYKWTPIITSPVMLSTIEDGKVVRGLAGIPSEGPVLMVGYHMLIGFEILPLITQFWSERNIRLRGIGHQMMFARKRKEEGRLPAISEYDFYRILGVVPVSGKNFYKLMSSKAHALLYPGGMRESLHRKGEQYKLFWPEQAEFVRMAARFGAKIVPFGAVGEDDFGEVVFDYDDQMKIPFFRNLIEDLTNEVVRLRSEDMGEVGNQDLHLPGILPKFPPGRFYLYFGKPIETAVRKQDLRDKDRAQELYMEVKCEVEKCLEFLKERRESDPYRNIFARFAYQLSHGFDSEIPTFEL